MSEKRYELKCNEINSWYIEKDGKVLIFDLFKSDAEILYTELNSLSDENEQLKQQLEEETDRVIKLEQYVYTKLCPKSEHYNEKVVSAIINTILGDV